MNTITMKLQADHLIEEALREDISSEDVTTNSVMKKAVQGEVNLICKQDGIIAGLEVFKRVFELLDANTKIEFYKKDGDAVKSGELLGVVTGDIRVLLSGERVALNYLQRMSGIATYTNSVAKLLAGTKTKLLDTRKTTPNMRIFEKYAVRVGGGYNHRYNLSDGVLLKDNHIGAAGSVTKAIQMAKDYAPFVRKIEVEVENLDMVKEAVEAGADIIISGAGLPTELPELVKGSLTKIAPIVSTEKSAKVILKYWDRKYKRTADLVVIEGPQAGGHLGFHKEELEKYTEESYSEEIKKIIATVKSYAEKYETEIPVIVAGGIYNREDVQKVDNLGADGIQVATRFITTEECDADIRYKEAHLKAKESDIAIVKSPVGMPGRAIMNKFMTRVMNGEQIPHSPCHGCLVKCSPKEIPYCITDGLINAVKGNVDEGLLFCGAKAWKAERLQTVQEVINDLF